METNVYVCKKCKREISENKELCQYCQNKKGDKKRKVFGGILGALAALVGILTTTKYLLDSDDESNNEEF